MPLKKTRVTLTFTWHVVLAGFLFLLFLLAGLAFGSFRLYQKVLATEELQRQMVETQAIERAQKEEEAHRLIVQQQAELTQTKEELEKTKTSAQKTTAQIQSLTQTLDEQSKAQKDIVISSNDLAPYVTGVAQVICSGSQGVLSGSGSLYTFKEVQHAVLTNYHVVKGATECVVVMTNTANTPIGIFGLKGTIYSFNTTTDEAVLDIGTSLLSSNVPISNYNYSLASLRKCPSPIAVGMPVVIAGFPAYAKRDSTITIDTIGTVNTVFRTATNGIISGYDTSSGGAPNYFVSAKIDSGNSGGVAIAKDTKGLCVLGLPTWLTVGNYENQGLVQNIANILPANQ